LNLFFRVIAPEADEDVCTKSRTQEIRHHEQNRDLEGWEKSRASPPPPVYSKTSSPKIPMADNLERGLTQKRREEEQK